MLLEKFVLPNNFEELFLFILKKETHENTTTALAFSRNTWCVLVTEPYRGPQTRTFRVRLGPGRRIVRHTLGPGAFDTETAGR